MKQNSATRRLAEEAREKISTILLMEISDPRLALVTVTGCEVSVDRSVCKVWVSASPESYDEVMEGLQSAKGRIRSLLGRSLTWRVTPELIFQIDRSTDEAMRITEALKNVPPTMAIPKDEFGYPLPAEGGEEVDTSDVSAPEAGPDSDDEGDEF